jgi:hypothetical protein
MRALSLTNDQLNQLRSTAATLPVELRNDFLKLIAGYMNVEGETTDAAFTRAYNFALDALHSHRDVN